MVQNMFFFQIQDADEPLPDNIPMGTSNSLSALDAQQKQSQCHNLDAVADTVFISLVGYLW